MKLILNSLLIFLLGFTMCSAQENSKSNNTSQKVTPSNHKAVQDSLEKDKKNGTIYSKVNKDGVIEITKKEFDKIPAERQEAIRKDKNYKIIEDK
jgi:hypothetical protein